MQLANKYRPHRFEEVKGQQGEVEILKQVVEKGWFPPAILYKGPFGCGKTTLARLTARALLCTSRKGHEPCGECYACTSMDQDNHPSYTEIDAASQGLIGDVRQMKEEVSYRTSTGPRIVAYDEAHMLSTAAQDALLKILEEGQKDLIIMMATTDAEKLLPTVRSRCVEIQVKLLTAQQVYERLLYVCEQEKVVAEEKALRILSTYVRGHMRDALIQLEQLTKLSSSVNETLVRTYLRLDKYIEVYDLLCLSDQRKIFTKLEELLCNYAPSELQEVVGQILLNAYKVRLGIEEFPQVDQAWLGKVNQSLGDRVLDLAEKILSLNTDYASINYGVVSMGKVLIGDGMEAPRRNLQLVPGAAAYSSTSVGPATAFRKPGKDVVLEKKPPEGS